MYGKPQPGTSNGEEWTQTTGDLPLGGVFSRWRLQFHTHLCRLSATFAAALGLFRGCRPVVSFSLPGALDFLFDNDGTNHAEVLVYVSTLVHDVGLINVKLFLVESVVLLDRLCFLEQAGKGLSLLR